MSNYSHNELVGLLVKITSLLERLECSYHLTGGLVSSYYGDPRYTQDIDIVIKINSSKLNYLLDELDKGFYIGRESILESFLAGRLFQALDQESYIKIDFHVGEGVPGELERSKTVELFDGVKVKITSLEDTIVSKLRWIKLGSEKSRNDVLARKNHESRILTVINVSDISSLVPVTLKLVKIPFVTKEKSYCGIKFGRILNQKMLAIFQYCCAFFVQPATRLLTLATDFHDFSGLGILASHHNVDFVLLRELARSVSVEGLLDEFLNQQDGTDPHG